MSEYKDQNYYNRLRLERRASSGWEKPQPKPEAKPAKKVETKADGNSA